MIKEIHTKNCVLYLCVKVLKYQLNYVLQDKNMRKKWFNNVHRTDKLGKWSQFCCQDHFNVLRNIFML